MNDCVINIQTQHTVITNEQARIKFGAFETKFFGLEGFADLIVPQIGGAPFPVETCSDLHHLVGMMLIVLLVSRRQLKLDRLWELALCER